MVCVFVFVCVCMCVYVCICVCVCMFECVLVCVFVSQVGRLFTNRKPDKSFTLVTVVGVF